MNCTFVFDSKTVLALGKAAFLVIIAIKLEPAAAEKALVLLNNAFGE